MWDKEGTGPQTYLSECQGTGTFFRPYTEDDR